MEATQYAELRSLVTREASTQTGFQHTPLRPREIRLLRLHANLSSPDALVASCEIVNLDERPKFVALSYCWGDPTPTRYLHLPHEALGITENLSQFLLRSLKLDISDNSIWIDAVCVDQSNPRERSDQVKLMGEIYSMAETVIIWLGEETIHSGLAFDLIQYICFQSISSEPCTSSALEAPTSRNLVQALESHTLGRKESPAWIELNRLLAWPWFMRIWVLQEIVLSTAAMVLCGTRHLPWAFLGRISLLFLHDLDFLYYATSACRDSWASGWVSISGIELLRARHQQMTMENFLHCFINDKVATDHRDYVFGILGICSDSYVITQELDYSCSLQEVFTTTTRNICRRGNSIRSLDHTGIGWRRTTEQLPSWVPDYTHLPKSMSSRLGFSATMNTDANMSFGPSNSLRLVGKRYEYVKAVGPVFANATKLNWKTWLAETKEVCSTARSNKDIFASTLSVASNEFNDYVECYDTFLGLTQSLEALSMYPAEAAHPIHQFLDGTAERDFIYRITNHVESRAVFQTDSGNLGICPPLTRPGDIISVFLGSVTPHILRHLETQPDVFQLVGQCYVHGIMNGEILEKGLEDEHFTLI